MVKKILIVLILLSLMIISVSANGPLSQTYLHVRIINIPEDAYYADLLIETNETDKSYSELEVDNTDKFEISEDSEIVKYNKDGYRSFTFHYKNAQSMIKIYSRDQLPDYMQDDYEEETGYVDFAYDPFDSDNNLLKDQYYDIKKNFTKIMIAITDKEGNILTISDKTDLSTKSFEYLYGWLTYDAASGNVEVNRKSSNFSFFFDIYILIFLRFI